MVCFDCKLISSWLIRFSYSVSSSWFLLSFSLRLEQEQHSVNLKEEFIDSEISYSNMSLDILNENLSLRFSIFSSSSFILTCFSSWLLPMVLFTFEWSLIKATRRLIYSFRLVGKVELELTISYNFARWNAHAHKLGLFVLFFEAFYEYSRFTQAQL